MIYLLVLFIAVIAGQAWLHSRERERLLETQEHLCDRIQAPEKARIFDPDEAPRPIPFDDDEAFAEVLRERDG